MRALVRNVLEYPQDRKWSIQGFGMMRTYLDQDKRYRLNIWDSRLAVPDVSIIHDHPWDFDSWIISGNFSNYRYQEIDEGLRPTHAWQIIKTGEGGGPTGLIKDTILIQNEVEHYKTGDRYHQWAEEIHASVYKDGTVTLNDRRRKEDGEHARLFWPIGQQWVDADPSEATPEIVECVLQQALARWN